MHMKSLTDDFIRTRIDLEIEETKEMFRFLIINVGSK